MKCSMEYGVNTYGNSANAPKYGVKLTRRKKRGEITILFSFENSAAGRGIGQAQGRVESVSLRLPASTAQALSHALQLAIADTASTDVEFEIDEASGRAAGPS